MQPSVRLLRYSRLKSSTKQALVKFGQKLLINVAPMLGKLKFHKAALASQMRERLQRLCNVLKYWKGMSLCDTR